MRPLEASDPRDIGRYRLLAELGRGGMGRVLLGYGPDGRLVALKLVHPRLTEDDGFRERFRREVAASRKVSGAYTAAVVDADPDAPIPWLVSVFVPGPSLQDAIDRVGVLPEEPAVRLAAGLASALIEVHRAGLVHRDLKPSNVLLADDGPRVIDFGIARATDTEGGDLTEAGWLVGSPCFMSPEQATSRTQTPASDVFSLGTVLVMAATGRCPFAGSSTGQILHNVVHASPDLGAVPERLRRIIEPCQAKDPASRPSPAELLESIGQLVPVARPWPPGVHALLSDQRAELEGLLDVEPDQTGETLRRTRLQLRPPYLSEAFPPSPPPGGVFPPTPPPPLFPPPSTPQAKPRRVKPPRVKPNRAKPAPSRPGTVGSVVGVLVLIALVFAAVSSRDRNHSQGLGSVPTTTAKPPDNQDRRQPDPTTTTEAPPTDGPYSATVGTCFEDRNVTGARSELHRARCDPGNFKVLKRIDGQSDSSTWCAGVEGTNWPLEWDATSARQALVLCTQYLYASDIYNGQPGSCAYGTPDGRSWHLVECRAYTFQILQVIRGTVDHGRCGSDPRLRLTTSTVEPRPTLSSVVCMTFRYGDDGPFARTNNCMRLRGSGNQASPVFANCDVANAVVTGYNPTEFNPAWCGSYNWYGWNDPGGWGRFLNYTICYRWR